MKSVIVFTLQVRVSDDTFSHMITNSNTINIFSFVRKAMSHNRVPPTVKSMGLSVFIRTHFVGNNAFHGKLEISVCYLFQIYVHFLKGYDFTIMV